MMKRLSIICSVFVIVLPLINTFSLSVVQQFNQPTGEYFKGKLSYVCKQIENSISKDSQVFYPGSPSYNQDIYHYATSSTMLSICSVEPGTNGDVSIIIKILGTNRVPFAIKSGGHALNPGFSSTPGVHIAMKRFNKTIYRPNNQTVDVGAGLIWDDVYQALEPYNVSVLGGRISGVGVGGFSLGGGYGWKSNQYGLTIDNIFEYQLISPNGTLVYVNNKSYPDIFLGLKGGLNNFGIVTNFNMRALPQTPVYGGNLFYTEDKLDSVLTATTNFQNNNKDPKAQLLCNVIVQINMILINVIAFYDAPIAPNDIFKEFTSIPVFGGTLNTSSYLFFILGCSVSSTANMRVYYNTVSLTNLNNPIVQKVKEFAINYKTRLITLGGTLATFILEPFLPSYFDNSQGGAYPHAPSSNPLLPFEFGFYSQSPASDATFINESQSVADIFLQTAVNAGLDVGNSEQIRYPNYVLNTTPLSQLYGDNLPRLKTIRAAWDPANVMGLAGGFKLI